MSQLSRLSLAASLLVGRTSAQSQLCYRIDFDKDLATDQFKQFDVIRPVVGFPKDHAKVVQGYCGGAVAGAPIPHGSADCTNCKFGNVADFASCGVKTDCITPPFNGCTGYGGFVNAGSMFYAYNFPAGSSSNIGYADFEATNVYFVQDEIDEIYLVLQHDKPGNADGGRINLSVDSVNVSTAFVAQKDDAAGQEHFGVGKDQNCATTTSDCFAWDDAQGKGTFSWNWVSCCTDGVVIGPMPGSSFSVNLTYTTMTGVNKYRFGTYDDLLSSMAFTSLTRQNFTNGLRVVGQTCDEFCANLDTCELCASIAEKGAEGGRTQVCRWGKKLGEEDKPPGCFARYDFASMGQLKYGSCANDFSDVNGYVSPTNSPSFVPTNEGDTLAPSAPTGTPPPSIEPTFPSSEKQPVISPAHSPKSVSLTFTIMALATAYL